MKKRIKNIAFNEFSNLNIIFFYYTILITYKFFEIHNQEEGLYLIKIMHIKLEWIWLSPTTFFSSSYFSCALILILLNFKSLTLFLGINLLYNKLRLLWINLFIRLLKWKLSSVNQHYKSFLLIFINNQINSTIVFSFLTLFSLRRII